MLIYLVTNRVNGKRYVGQTSMSLARRWQAHCAAAGSARPMCRILCAAIRKYGREAFNVIVVRELSDATQAQADVAEAEAIRTFGTLAPDGYNLEAGGSRGAMHEDSKAMLRAAHSGRRRPGVWRENISKSLIGRRHPPERVEKMRAGKASGRGWFCSADTRAKIGAAFRGKPWSAARRRAYEESRAVSNG